MILLFLSVMAVFVYGILLQTGKVKSNVTVASTDTIEVASAVHDLEARFTAFISKTKEVDYSKEYKPTEYVPDSSIAEKISSNDTRKTVEDESAGVVIDESGTVSGDKSEKTDAGEKQELAEGDTSFCGENDGFYRVTDGYLTNGDTLFIGDSRTKGFALYSGLQGINVYAEKGYSVNKVFTDKFIDTVLGKLTLEEAMAADTDRYRKIYLMLGLNEMGWGNDEMFANAYYRMIDMLKYYQPNAVIYVQDIIHVTKAKGESAPLYGNANIDARNELLKEIADNEHVVYLNINQVFSDEEGDLPAEYSSDGVHIKQQYMQQWVDFLESHAVLASDADASYITDPAEVDTATGGESMKNEDEDTSKEAEPVTETAPVTETTPNTQENTTPVAPTIPVTPTTPVIPTTPEIPTTPDIGTGTGGDGWETGQDLN